MKRPALILICLLLQACSATTKELGNSLWDSLFGTPGVQLTDDDIQNMPYASQYMCNFAFFSGLIDAQFWAGSAQPKSPELTANYC